MSGNSDQDKGWAGKAIASFRDGAKAVMDVLREAAESTGTLITWSADPTTLKPSDSLKACILLFVLWVGFFAVGATTETQNIVCRLNEYNFVFLLPVLAVTYTYSNIAFLAFLSGLLGGVLSNLSLSSYMRTTGSSVAKLLQEEDPRSISYRLEPPIASGIRSFAIYLLYIAGISIVVPVGDSSQTVLTVDAAQYIRIAGIISAVGFAVGFDPTIFNGLLSRLNLAQPAPPTKTPPVVSQAPPVAAPSQGQQPAQAPAQGQQGTQASAQDGQSS